jgi:proteic killer suppression protein
MDVRFVDTDLDRLETDARFTAGKSPALVNAFRKRMQLIRAAKDERDLRAQKSWRFEKLEGARSHQYSIRLNDQFRLIVEIEGSSSDRTIVVVSIEDYH